MNATPTKPLPDFFDPAQAADRWGGLTMQIDGKDVRHCIFRELDGYVWEPVFEGAVLLGYRRRVDTIGMLARGPVNSP